MDTVLYKLVENMVDKEEDNVMDKMVDKSWIRWWAMCGHGVV